MRVQYTDIDYWVYSDAAKHVLNGGSAFDRHTYRYTPLLAWILVPNEFVGAWWGKAVFSAAGVLSGILIYRLTNRSTTYASLWLFSPLTVNISTRGSSDSLIILLILLVFYEMKFNRLNWAAVWFGLAVHLRIFPIFFVIPIIVHLASFKKVLIFGLISGSVCLGLIGLFYIKDGFRFVYEAYLYHLVRKDHRHNFSLFYYATYLAASETGSVVLTKILTFAGFLPQLGSLVFVGVRFGRENFMFSIFLQTIIFVAFNKVITAQYFLWYFGLFPVALYIVLEKSSSRTSTVTQIVVSVVLWALAEVFWLKASYGLEVEGRHNFRVLLTASACLFISHIVLLVVFIRAYIDSRSIEKKRDHPASTPEISEAENSTARATLTRRKVSRPPSSEPEGGRRTRSRSVKKTTESSEEPVPVRRSARLKELVD